MGEHMKVLSRPAAAFGITLLLIGVACRKETKEKEVATVAQDTMLLRDLAEANRNTAAASAVDNSLNTVRTSGDGSFPPLAGEASQGRPVDRVVPRPSLSGTPTVTSGPRLTPPLKATDASGPTTVPIDRSPASSSASSSPASSSPASGSASSSGNPCDSPSPADQRDCLNRSILANDADLNRTYQELIAQARKSGGSDLEEQFRQSQREWIDQRDADCRAQAQSDEGKLWARARARCLADYSAKRTAELQRSLSNLRDQ